MWCIDILLWQTDGTPSSGNRQFEIRVVVTESSGSPTIGTNYCVAVYEL